ncbi:hypothetical protein RDWZM_003727 [Blomia tropicalis]|uniref:Uncharacterized protein n=1 Tax=Blomia tropicalis TaxID=40697 RepID=A0A9Q0MIU3_BLOTA|nr:hypothetical protein RDWZM_003727 [Blomia tropicalis]
MGKFQSRGKWTCIHLLIVAIFYFTLVQILYWAIFSNYEVERSKFEIKNLTKIHKDSILQLLPVKFQLILTNNSKQMFLIEPQLLQQCYLQESNNDWIQYHQRMNLPLNFQWSKDHLTVGLFANQLESRMRAPKLSGFKIVQEVFGPIGTSSNTLYHIFYKSLDNKFSLHVIVFNLIGKHYWIGKISDSVQFWLQFQHKFSIPLHFGINEQLYDLFQVNIDQELQIYRPNNIKHFLGQYRTLKYIANCRFDGRNREQLIDLIKNFKQFAQEVEIEFWLPIAKDKCSIQFMDRTITFVTWSKYFPKLEEPKHDYTDDGIEYQFPIDDETVERWKFYANKYNLCLQSYHRNDNLERSNQTKQWIQFKSQSRLGSSATIQLVFTNVTMEINSISILGYKLLASNHFPIDSFWKNSNWKNISLNNGC